MSNDSTAMQNNESVLDRFIMPVEKERRGYAAHFSKVYEPFILQWIACKVKVKPDMGTPAVLIAAQHAPFMLSAFPVNLIDPHREQVESTVRLCLLTEKEMENAEDWSARWRYKEIQREANAIGKAMWLYRCGYDKVHFTFHGGHDQGSTDDHKITRGEEEMEEIIENEFPLKDFVEDFLPSGFGDGEPAYDDGQCSITLKTMKFSVECSMSVTRSEWVERKGTLLDGIDLDYHDD